MPDESRRENNFEEFLRAEYSSLNTSLIESEQLGERRIQFLISLAGALITVGGLVSFSNIVDLSEVIPGLAETDGTVSQLLTFAVIMSFLLALIIVFGYITFIRIVNRNAYTDYYKYRIDKIRAYYVPFEYIQNYDYLAFNPYPDNESVGFPKARHLKHFRDLFSKGGIVITVILLNTILFALFFSIVTGFIVPYFIGITNLDIRLAVASFFGFIIGWIAFRELQISSHNRYSEKFTLDLSSKWFSLLFMAHREREDVLIMCSDNNSKKNEQIFKEILNWKISSYPYQLIPQNSKEFWDIYIDTPERYLRQMKIALRVRKDYNKNLVTLKIPTSENIETGRNDIEIEKAWSKVALNDIFTVLLYHIKKDKAHEKVVIKKINEISKNIAKDGPSISNDITDRSIEELGLQVVQKRYTKRETRNIIHKAEKSEEVLAELVIDSVVFDISNKKIHHYDIEVEEKTRNGASVTARESIMEIFTKSNYGPFLKKWKHGKIVLGYGIEKLISNRDLREPEYESLKCGTYETIEKMIETGELQEAS